MDIILDKNLENFVNDSVSNGSYDSREAVIEQGLKLLKEQEVKKQWLKREIEKGLACDVTYTVDEVNAFLDKDLEDYDSIEDHVST